MQGGSERRFVATPFCSRASAEMPLSLDQRTVPSPRRHPLCAVPPSRCTRRPRARRLSGDLGQWPWPRLRHAGCRATTWRA